MERGLKIIMLFYGFYFLLLVLLLPLLYVKKKRSLDIISNSKKTVGFPHLRASPNVFANLIL